MAKAPKQKRMRAKAVEEQEEELEKANVIAAAEKTGDSSVADAAPGGVPDGAEADETTAANEEAGSAAEAEETSKVEKDEPAEEPGEDTEVPEATEKAEEEGDGEEEAAVDSTAVVRQSAESDVASETKEKEEADAAEVKDTAKETLPEAEKEESDEEEDDEDDDYDEEEDDEDDKEAGEAQDARQALMAELEAEEEAEEGEEEKDAPSPPRDTLDGNDASEAEKAETGDHSEGEDGKDATGETQEEEETVDEAAVKARKRKKKKKTHKSHSDTTDAAGSRSLSSPKKQHPLRQVESADDVTKAYDLAEVPIRKKAKDRLNRHLHKEDSGEVKKKKRKRKSMSQESLKRSKPRSSSVAPPLASTEESRSRGASVGETEEKSDDSGPVQWARSAEAEAIMQMLKAEAGRINDPQHGKTIEVEAKPVVESATVDLLTCQSAVADIDFASLSDREKILNEIITTERSYVQDLNVIIHIFLKPLREAGLLSLGDIQQVFSNIEVIFDINKEFNSDLQERVQEKGGVDILVGDLFLKLSAYFKLYTMYCINQSVASQKFRELCDGSIEFRQLMLRLREHEACRKMDLPSFLIKPMQRLCKYPLLIRELLRKTDADHPDRANLEAAMEQVSGVVKYINERKRVGENQQKIVDIQHLIEGCPSILAASRKFIRDASITIVENKTTHKRQLYLFNDMLLTAKVQKKGLLANSEEVPRHIFDRLVDLKDLKIVDHADTDDVRNAFELCHKVDVLLFQFMVSCETAESKRGWIKDIKSIVKNHQREEYLANKDRLVKEQEEREQRRQAIAALSRTEVNPLPSENSDSWTLGLILWHLYTGRPLFEGLTFEQAAVALMTRSFVPPTDDPTVPLPQDLTELVQDCWLEEADSRPSFSMAYDRIRMLDTQRPENPFAVGMAVEQAKQMAARARMTVIKPTTPTLPAKKKK